MFTFLRRLGAVLFGVLLMSELYGQCQQTGPYPVNENEVFEFTLTIDSIDVDDLSDPSQGLCAVTIEYEHQSVADMLIELESPAGQIITLVGPIANSDLTFFTQWNISFLPCAATPDPDLDFDDTYSNLYSWGVLGEANGSYYPYSGCLEDFDDGTITGDWTIKVRDQGLFYSGEIQSITLFFCNPAGLSCLDCSVPESELTSDSLTYCTADQNPSSPDIGFNPTFDSSFHQVWYSFNQDDSLIQTTSSFSLDSLEAGDYELCLWTVEKSDSSNFHALLDTINQYDSLLQAVETEEICAQPGSCVPLTLIDNLDTLQIDTILCEGEELVFMADTILTSGQFSFEDTSSTCPLTIELNVIFQNPRASLGDIDTLSCNQSQITIDGGLSETADSTRFVWKDSSGTWLGQADTLNAEEAGVYRLIVSDGLCYDSLDFTVEADFSTPYFELRSDSTINCNRDSAEVGLDSIEGGAFYYWVNQSAQDTIFQDSFWVTEPDTFIFYATGENGCIDSASLSITTDFRRPEFQIDTNQILCEGGGAELTLLDTSGNYEYQWVGPNGFSSTQRDTMTDSPGMYILTATLTETGCDLSDTLDLEITERPLLPQVNSDTLDCINREVQIVLDSVHPDYEYYWLDSQRDTLFEISPTVNTPGAYTLWVTEPDACFDTLRHQVIEDINFPNFEVVLDTLNCTTDSAEIYLNFLSNRSSFVVSWEDPIGRVFIGDTIRSGLPGIYIYTLSNGDQCVTSDSVSLIEDFTPFNHSLSADTLTCNRSESELTITGGTNDFSFEWGGPDGFTENGDTLRVSTPGAYTVAITSINCYYERGIRVEEDKTPPEWIWQLDTLNCSRDTGRIDFIQSDAESLSVFDPDNSIFNPLPDLFYDYDLSGVVRFQLTGKNGCSSDSTILLPVDTLIPSFQIDTDTLTCDQREGTFSWTSESSVTQSSWQQDGIERSNADTVWINSAAPLRLELTFPNGCVSDTLLNIPVDTIAPELSLSPRDLNCALTSYPLEVDIGSDWSSLRWFLPSGDSVINTTEITIQQSGDYLLEISGQNGCPASRSFTIAQDTSLPNFSFSNTLIPCDQNTTFVIPEGDSSELEQFYWRRENGETTSEWSPELPAGTHTFVFTAENQCRDSAEVIIEQDRLRAVVEGLDERYFLNCFQPADTLQPQISGSIDTAFWQNPDGSLHSGSEKIITSAGRYLFIVQERDICRDSFEIEVELDTLAPQAELFADSLSCDQPQVRIETEVTATEPRFAWNGPNGFTSSVPDPIVSSPGNYQLTLIDENGCMTIKTIEVEADLRIPEVQLPDTLYKDCDRNLVQVSIDIQSDESVQWRSAGEVVSQEPSFSYLPGNLLVVAVQGPNGCVGIDSVLLSVEEQFPETQWQLPVLACDNLQDTIAILSTDGDYDYSWEGPNNFTSTAEEPTVRAPGLYRVAYANAARCETVDSLRVEASSQPPAFTLFTEDTLRCLDSIARYEIRPQDDTTTLLFQWESLSGQVLTSSTMPEARLQGPGRFVVTVQDVDSFCVASDTLDLQFAPENEWSLAFSVYDQYCIEDSLNGIELFLPEDSGLHPFQIILQGDTVSQEDLLTLMPGDYEITLYDRQGCLRDSSFSVVDRSEEQVFYIGEDRDVSLGQELSIVPETSVPQEQHDFLSWVVNTQDSCFQCNPFEWVIRGSTQIEASLTTVGGCVLTDVLRLLPPIEDLVFVPNIFSPNDDGVNDFFYIQSAARDLQTIDEIQIFNRSGNILFERRDFPPNARREGWDGTFKGQKQDPQVLVVLLTYTFEGEQRVEVHDLTLIH
jgi:gliding motility-associated-like protein